nr:Ig-like domain repeat protein [Conyzicola lurida]
MRSLLASADSYWTAETQGSVVIPVPSAITVVRTAARSTDSAKSVLATVASEIGFTQGAYKTLVVFTPATSVISASGASVAAATYGNSTENGGQIIVSAKPKTDTVLANIVTHEFGHLFSIGHANRLGCGDGHVDSLPAANGKGWQNTTCATVEYDDNNDVMSNGYARGALNSVLASEAGFTKATDVLTVTPTATATSYTLLPWADDTITTAKAIRITDSSTGIPFYVELRTAVGLDSADAVGVRAGVKILKANSAGGGSVTLDPTPTLKKLNTDGKQTWDAGSTFVNASQTLGVTITNVSATRATVSVVRLTPQTAAAYQAKADAATPQVTATASTTASYYGTAGTLTIVSRDAKGAAITGTVAVSEGSTAIATATITSTGTATVTIPKTATAGVHHYTLVHSVPGVRSGSVALTVAKATPTLAATASATTVTAGTAGATTAITLTIPTNIPLSGTVTVTKDGAAAGSLSLTSASKGSASYAVGALTAGKHTLTFSYAGAGNTLPAKSSVVITAVDAANAASVTATSAGASTYYANQGTLAITAKNGKGVGVAGTVTVYEGSTKVGAVAVPATGTASFALPKTVSAGTHTYRLVHSTTAVQSGSVSHTVAKAKSTTVARATATVIAAGDTTAAVKVSATIPGVGLVGTVTVADNGAAGKPIALNAANKGTGTFALGSLTAGKHTLVFSYTGGANTTPSSATVVVTVK